MITLTIKCICRSSYSQKMFISALLYSLYLKRDCTSTLVTADVTVAQSLTKDSHI